MHKAYSVMDLPSAKKKDVYGILITISIYPHQNAAHQILFMDIKKSSVNLNSLFFEYSLTNVMQIVFCQLELHTLILGPFFFSSVFFSPV